MGLNVYSWELAENSDEERVTYEELVERVMYDYLAQRGQLNWEFSGSIKKIVRDVLIRLCQVTNKKAIKCARRWVKTHKMKKDQLHHIPKKVLRQWGLVEGQVITFREQTIRFCVEKELRLLPEKRLRDYLGVHCKK